MTLPRTVFLGLTLTGLAAAACATTTPPPSGEAPAARAAALDCRRGGDFGPVSVSPAQYLARTGARAKAFSALSTTKELPLEECGIRAVLERLVTLRCDDGTNPFGGNGRAAHRSRAGSLGPGGRCGSIIDQYDVACGAVTYKIFADSYVCPEGAEAAF